MLEKDPRIVVTRIGNIGWGVRCFNPSGSIFLEGVAKTQIEIGPMARSFLRMWDKCGGSSTYADRARHRAVEKLRIEENN